MTEICRYCEDDAVGTDALGRDACEQHIESVADDLAAMTPTQPTPQEQVEALTWEEARELSLKRVLGEVTGPWSEAEARWHISQFISKNSTDNLVVMLARFTLALLTRQSQERAEHYRELLQAERDALEESELLVARLQSCEETLRTWKDWVPTRVIRAALAASPGKGAEGEPADG